MVSSKYQVFTLQNFRQIPQVQQLLSQEECHNIEVVANVLPFKVNNYVIEELIDWPNIPNDPMYQLTFPQKEMLQSEHFLLMEEAIAKRVGPEERSQLANSIRYQLNPHSSGQQNNIPTLHEQKLKGIQHKYRETVLFFPSNSQTCHAYCTFCFRWPQFVGMDGLKFSMNGSALLVDYLLEHPEVTDVVFTGGDPMVMSARQLESYINPIINAGLPSLKTIRIGTKVLSYWPYKFLTDKDADDTLRLFERIVNKGYHLAFMAHFNHVRELRTQSVQDAIRRILSTGAVIRTQTPVMRHINDSVEAWKEMWKEQVRLGCVPYYMFLARDTGAQDYFAGTLEEAFRIYRSAFNQVSGVVRTARGPVMSADPGKIEILGIEEVGGERVFVLRFIQARNPDWVGKPFFAKYDADAVWLHDLVPAFGKDKFFFEETFCAQVDAMSEIFDFK